MELQQLIADVEQSGSDPLQRVEAAAAMRHQMEQLSDEVLDHFVKEARAAGCSWAQIGEALGVTRQAAQQRHGGLASRLWQGLTDGLFKRFTPRAKSAVTASQDEARARHHSTVETEHILLGLFASAGGNVATVVLEGMGIDREAVARAVDELVPSGEGSPRGHVPFSKRAKKTLELALRESLRLGHNYVGCEHILLALARVEDGTASRVLTDLGATHDRLEQAIREHLRSIA
jgi:hypothetical protein